MPDLRSELSLDTLDARLRKLEDIEEIRNLRFVYHHYINIGRFGDVANLYTDDAEVDLDVAGRAFGRDDIRALYEKIPETLDFVKQFTHNHMVDVDGDFATGISYMEARYVRVGESGMVACDFKEKYRRTMEGWRIHRTDIHVYFAVPLAVGWAGLSKEFMPSWR